MPKPETRAWWDDVQHLRDSIERKRRDQAHSGLRLDARAAARAVAERAASEPPAVAEAPGADDGDAALRRSRRFDRPTAERRGRFARAGHDGHDDGPRPLEVPARRRTVEITGRPVGTPTLPRLIEIDRRRPARRPVERVGTRPDRLALWAVVLGMFLILVAVTSTSHAATRAHATRAASVGTPHHEVVRTHAAALRATPPAR